ncbi:MAG: DUF1737 domain-containing protein [Deltaproteobacteria bacterium]|nr:DUF1737 domain-containing protein [Deltaproteobacteria bacterium]
MARTVAIIGDGTFVGGEIHHHIIVMGGSRMPAFKYKLVCVKNDKEEFNEEISVKLSEGWELYGDPHIICWVRRSMYKDYCTKIFYQAMVKYS